MKTRTVAALAALIALTAAGPAAASSIVYEKDSNVWVANPDGSGQHQVTTGGTSGRPYGSPSQADDGTIVAAHGNEIVRLRQNGEELSRFDPPGTTDSAGQPIDGVPQDLAVSPDGSKVAFSYYQYGCPIGASCGARTVLLYSSSSAATPVAQYGKLYRRNASWLADGRILAFGGYLSQVNVDSPGGGDDDDQHWFDDQDINSPSTDLGDGELSRQGDRLVALRNYGADLHLQLYAVSGGVPSGPPAEACFGGPNASLDNPTWSPDGRAIAYAVAGGIEVLPLPSVTPGYCEGAGTSSLVLPGAANPDWGPAPVNPGPRPGPRTDPGTGPTGPVNPTRPGGPSCRRLKGKPRDRCVHRAAVATCRKAGSRRRRARCVRRANRALAMKACARKPRAAKRRRCASQVRRRFR